MLCSQKRQITYPRFVVLEQLAQMSGSADAVDTGVAGFAVGSIAGVGVFAGCGSRWSGVNGIAAAGVG